MKRILVTGGSGFIGTNLVNYYVQMPHTEVLNIDVARPRNAACIGHWSNTDILDYDALLKTILQFNPTHVLHMAARTDLDERHDIKGYEANIKGVSNVIKALQQCRNLQRAIFASSMLVCKAGYHPNGYSDYCPANLYGESKVQTEVIIKRASIQQFEWAIVRPTSIWGPWFGEPYRNFFDMVKAGKYYKIRKSSSTKTFGFVGNAVHQIDRLLFLDRELVHEKTFYIGDKPPSNINEWADEIAAELNIKLHTLPNSVFRIAAIVGDCLLRFNIRFPMTSFRLNNMQTDNVITLLDDTFSVMPEQPYSRKEGVKLTLKWMEEMSLNNTKQ